MEFCKLFTVYTTVFKKKTAYQVLVIMSHDESLEDDEQYIVETITEYNGVRLTAKHGYPTAKLQEADFETYGQEEAQKFFDSFKALGL